MHIIVGLGNPGKKYENTRHNLGFTVLDEIARRNGLSWREDKKFKAVVAEGNNCLLVKPQTFMNLSGESIAAIMRYYKLIPRSLFGIQKGADLSGLLTVIHDDLDIAFGAYKISIDSSSAGQRGVQSIIDHLKTKNFKRLRIGIGSDNRRQIPTEKYVLQHLDDAEQIQFKTLLDPIIQTALTE